MDMSAIEITTKRPSDSSYEKVFSFANDLALRAEYVNYFGDLRFGKLLEELDMTAGKTSYLHADGFEKGLTIVTAACDRIDLLEKLRIDADLRLRAQVNWVGNSSMEIGIRIESKVMGVYQLVARAYFIMVARKHGKAIQVNRLLVESEEEKRRFAKGEQRQIKRKVLSQTNYLKSPPTEKESELLHTLYLRIKHGELYDGVLMNQTLRQSTILMHPQEKNIHHQIFGGYTMRLSFELAWNIAYLYCQKHPLFVTVDHIYFYKSIEIGAIMSYTGLVTYTGTTSFIVEITAEVIDPRSGETEVTNVCYFTFVSVNEEEKPIPVPSVLPHSYEEGLKYLDGAKRYAFNKTMHQNQTIVPQ